VDWLWHVAMGLFTQNQRAMSSFLLPAEKRWPQINTDETQIGKKGTRYLWKSVFTCDWIWNRLQRARPNYDIRESRISAREQARTL